MKRKFCFCILCIALFLCSGCADKHHGENGNGSGSGNGNSVSNETGGSQKEDSQKQDVSASDDVMSGNLETEMQTTSGGGNAITEEEAKKLALDRIPGATENDIREFKMDWDDGRAEYEGEIIYNGMEYEFEIDASSGTFTDWEQESVNH